MSSEDESEDVEDQEKTDEKEDLPSSRQAKKVARLNQILYENEHKAKISKVSKILKKKDHERTEEDREVLIQSPEITNRLSKLKERRGALKQRQLEIEDPKEFLELKCKELATAIRHSDKVVVYTGAGISTAASIPDYRGPNGVWTLLQKGQQPIAQDLCDAKPTLTHMSIKKLQDEGHISHVVSQNCDGLHMRSGLNRRKLSEVHGNMYIEICYNCKPHQEYIRLFDVTEKTGVRRHQTDRNCHTCKEPLKDTIVHFGEKGGMKCPYRWKEAAKAADRCDIILCLGTSLKILKKYSCLWCMDRKMKNRPKLYIVNLQWTPRDDAATMKINGRCDEVMKMVLKELKYSIPMYHQDDDPLFSLSTPLLEDELNTTTKKILEIPDVKTITRRRSTYTSTQESVKCEDIVIKSEHVYCDDNHTDKPYRHSNNHTIKSVLDNAQLASHNFYRFNGMWSAPPLFQYSPFGLPSFIPGIPNAKQHIRFGEVSFQKYLDKGDNHKKKVIVKSADNMFGDLHSERNMSNKNSDVKQNCSKSIEKKELCNIKQKTDTSALCHEQKDTASVSEGQSDSNTDKSQKCERSKTDTSISSRISSGRRTRKSFCANCHGLSGKCPCTVLDLIKKKKPSCSTCQQSQQQCTCSKNKNLSVCPLCRHTTDKCECHHDSLASSTKCDSCRLSNSMCKCRSISKRPQLCQLCRHTPDKCKCVQNSQRDVTLCPNCLQHKSVCKCTLNHTSSSTQGTNVPHFSSLPRLPYMPLLDYAKYAFPMNNFLPFYSPQVFHNNHVNGLLPSNNMNGLLKGLVPSNPMNTMLPFNTSMNGLFPIQNNKECIDPILQDHSYLNKDQMQSISPNCDKKEKRSQQVKDNKDVKPNLKRSYSYVDDIQKEEEDFAMSNKSPEKLHKDHSKLKIGDIVDSSEDVESSSPIIVIDEEEEEDKEGVQEKPKLMRSVSVPGWFGKGLNLRKKRR